MEMKRDIQVHVDPKSEVGRLDVWLGERFTYRSRSQWSALVRKGEILVNDQACRPSRKLRAGDVVRYVPSNLFEPDVDVNFRIVHEDDALMVVDKPGNLPCHPAGGYFENTLWAMLKNRFDHVSIVHRLDRETSGLLVVAKNPRAAAALSAAFASGEVEKRYLALVFGQFPPERLADGWLVPDATSVVRKKRVFRESVDDDDGEWASTQFRLIAASERFSAVEAMPKTGRLHQIRATLRSLGFPLLGDKIYGPDDSIFIRFVEEVMTDEDVRRLVLSRQALHAWRLRFPHPDKETVMEFEIPVADDMISTYETILEQGDKTDD